MENNTYVYMNHQYSVGFYYNCYKNKYATDKILEQLRQIYPTEPVFLLSDKGDDFSDIALKYNCFYKYSDINILGGRIINGKNENKLSFFLITMHLPQYNDYFVHMAVFVGSKKHCIANLYFKSYFYRSKGGN